mgnify:CR=1 FL=1
MGKLEVASGKRRRKQNVQHAVLAAVAVTGLLAWTAVAPNTLQLLRYLPNEKYNLRYRAKTAAGRIVTKGLARWVEKNGKKFLRLTEAGHKALALEQAKVALKNQKKRWDRRWRMIAFDIPERRRSVRFRLRGIMREIGFVRLQDSVWVYPYDCEDFVALLKAELKIGKDVLYAIVDTIEHDKNLRLHFNLPNK